ncbi:helix-turn-helix transcriptional regulator [Tepidibacillus marianensis]|uniref:helix-turn-helix transcriptional regulator n=1 Tax=Tepidibacillus marianensis TaxID=3131995 RepID=UPI0030CB4009
MFKENVKKLLNERSMKVGTLASTIGVSYSTMDSIINGNVDEMRIGVDKVLAIAEYFGVSVEELYGRPVVKKVVEEVPVQAANDLSAEELELIKLWREALPDGRAAAKAVLLAYKGPLKNKSAI